MKRSVIILLVLIAFFSIPALASTPQPENAPAPTSEDTMFLGLEQMSDEELKLINGNQMYIDDPSLILVESHTRKLTSYELKIIQMALESMGFSQKSIKIIMDHLNNNGGIITTSLYIDSNGNPMMVIY